jgi:hypothetical protein
MLLQALAESQLLGIQMTPLPADGLTKSRLLARI